jgi:hypothetical protein
MTKYLKWWVESAYSTLPNDDGKMYAGGFGGFHSSSFAIQYAGLVYTWLTLCEPPGSCPGLLPPRSFLSVL